MHIIPSTLIGFVNIIYNGELLYNNANMSGGFLTFVCYFNDFMMDKLVNVFIWFSLSQRITLVGG